MNLALIDWIIIVAFFVISMLIGVLASRKAGKSVQDYFLSGRNMPWWLLGVSMVATTFSADTPNLVTNIIRQNGVAGNWVWWAFLFTGMTTVFIYAKLWRRSGITTDLAFYELRYSGAEATFLRVFRALYLGVFFNVMIMAGVLLAGIKIASVMLGISPQQTVWLVSIITVVYAALGGLRGVILTDFFQFGLSMLGLVVAAIYIVNLPEVGGLSNLLQHQNVVDNIAVIPDLNDWNVAVPLFLIPLAVQWWSTWYPGAEPGGGGYIAQRMLSAKTEEDAEKATMFFNFAHYALRPWPWIIIALASMVVFPDLQTIQAKFLHVDAAIVADDLAFSAMLTYLPKGLLGLVIAALIAALMSTISTHLNWGASYVVNDFYIRIIEPKATEKTQIVVGRMATVVLMLLAALVALYLKDAMQSFNILLQIGAGTGLLFLLRWFWWRINAFSEIAAMLVSLIMAIYFQFFYVGNLADYQKMLWSVGITTFVWILVTLLTRPSEEETLEKFVALIKPHPYGWRKIIGGSPKIAALYQNKGLSLGREILMMFLGVFMIYAALFFTGYCLYGNYVAAIITGAVSIVCMWLLYRQWQQR